MRWIALDARSMIQEPTVRRSARRQSSRRRTRKRAAAPRLAVRAACGTSLGRICDLRRAILRGEYSVEARLEVVVERLLAELWGVPGCRRRRTGA